MEIIDAQIHEPEPAHVQPVRDPDPDKLRFSCEIALAAMDAVGVDKALLHASLELNTAATTQYPERFKAVAQYHHHPADVNAFVCRASEDPGTLGIRVSGVVNWKDDVPPEGLQRGDYEPLFKTADVLNVPVLMSVPGYASDLVPILEKHPSLTMIVDHFGLRQPPPTPADPEPFERLPKLLGLARFPNVAVKFSGAPSLSRSPYPFTDVWPYLHKVIEAFGVRRLMWGSDYTRLRYAPGTTHRGPRSSWVASYAESVGFLRDTTELSLEEKREIFGGTLRRLLRWPGEPGIEG